MTKQVNLGGHFAEEDTPAIEDIYAPVKRRQSLDANKIGALATECLRAGHHVYQPLIRQGSVHLDRHADLHLRD